MEQEAVVEGGGAHVGVVRDEGGFEPRHGGFGARDGVSQSTMHMAISDVGMLTTRGSSAAGAGAAGSSVVVLGGAVTRGVVGIIRDEGHGDQVQAEACAAEHKRGGALSRDKVFEQCHKPPIYFCKLPIT